MQATEADKAFEEFILAIPFQRATCTIHKSDLLKALADPAFQAKFVAMCGAVCKQMGRAPFDKDGKVITHDILPRIFLYFTQDSSIEEFVAAKPSKYASACSIPDPSHTHTYLYNRGRDIVRTLMSIRLKYYPTGKESYPVFMVVGYGRTCHLYSMMALFAAEHLTVVPGERYKSLCYEQRCAKLGLERSKKVVEALHSIRNSVESLKADASWERPKTREGADAFAEALKSKLLEVVCGCQHLLDRYQIQELHAHRLALAVLRVNGLSTGRFFQCSTAAGIYEDHTAANFCWHLENLCSVLSLAESGFEPFACSLHDARHVPVLFRVKPWIIFQLCDSAVFHLDCVASLADGETSVRRKRVMYAQYQPPEVEVPEGSFDGRLALDAWAPALYLSPPPLQTTVYVLLPQPPPQVDQEQPLDCLQTGAFPIYF